MTGQPIHVLLVEDNPGDARLIEDMLARAPGNRPELTHAVRLVQALALLEEKRFDLVLLDLSLPDSRHLDTCRALRARHPNTPVVVLTGLDDRALAMQAVREGAHEYLVKGEVTDENLVRVLHKAVARHEHQQESEEALREVRKLAAHVECMLSERPPAVPGYDVVRSYRPAFHATGDYHDFFPRGDGGTAVFLGDATGHGPTASMVMVQLRTILATDGDLHGEPGPALTAAARKFCAAVPYGNFMTGVYTVFGCGGSVSWASAAHDPPLHINRCGVVAPRDITPLGPMLGLDPAAVYQTVCWQLQPGDRLLLFTDGLVEVRDNQRRWFRECLCSHVAELTRVPLGHMVPELIARAAAHGGGAPFADDVTVIAVERRA
jgi:serine phosphatase RsbU (regulator of sigma subunit)